jgi:hypothetical protein
MMTEAALPTISRTEEPCLKFTRFGVALHFVAHRGPDQPQPVPRSRIEFASFEEDLFSYSYVTGRRQSTPFASEIVRGNAPEIVSLSWPTRISYESEGRVIDLHVERSRGPREASARLEDHEDRRHDLAVKASRTDFRDGVSVFHLVFNAGPSATHLDEYDLVTLSKLWQIGEDGEHGKTADIITFGWSGNGGGKSVMDLALTVFGEPASRFEATGARRYVRCGTIQLITGTPARALEWNAIWSSILALRGERQPRLWLNVLTRARQGKRLRQMQGLGGILQGLLDFRHVDMEELKDVFAQVEIDDSSLLGIHKGTLLCIAESDRVYSKVESTIGVSPYLLLPQAVLLHNEAVLDEAEGLQLAEKQGQPGKFDDRLSKMRTALAEYLPNVFHYRLERQLFRQGETSRGLSERRTQLMEKTSKFQTDWEQEDATRRSMADDIRNVLLFWLGCLGTYSFVTGTRHRLEIAAVFLFLAALMLVYSRWTSIGRRLKDTAAEHMHEEDSRTADRDVMP